MKALLIDPEWKLGREFALLAGRRRAMATFPVINKSIIEHDIELLHRKGVDKITVACSEGFTCSYLESICEKYRDKIDVNIISMDYPRGTAGILKSLNGFIGDEPFLMMNSNLYLEDIDLEHFLDFHTNKHSVVTVGVRRETNNGAGANIESIRIMPDGQMKDVHIIHHSIDRRSPWRFSGLYMLSPEVVQHIKDDGYVDMNEQLIPHLQEKDLLVYTYEVSEFHKNISNMQDYFKLHRELFEMKSKAVSLKDKLEIAEDVQVGKNTIVSENAYLKGPIIMGDNCTLGKHAQIIGPAVIGDNCYIGDGAVVRECILWSNVRLEKRTKSEYSILGDGIRVPTNKNLRNAIVAGDICVGDMNFVPQSIKFGQIESGTLAGLLYACFRKLAYHAVKRMADITLSLLGLLLLSPLMCLLALIIKVDSGFKGPVFYSQKRCGKHGDSFNMFKFRTMVCDAEKIHADLVENNENDGPMFKMDEDPRVTKVGKFLRKTSLDELPQLCNVLRGEMSLVGPRPLIMDEMKFSPSWRDARLKAKPGITGLWQVQGRSDAPFHEWIKYDMEYVINQSLWLDFKILLKTIVVVLVGTGAK